METTGSLRPCLGMIRISVMLSPLYPKLQPVGVVCKRAVRWMLDNDFSEND
jgi:hypothetical protein